MSERQNTAFQLSFNGFLKVDFQGAWIMPDGGLKRIRERDERLGFGELVNDSRLMRFPVFRACSSIRCLLLINDNPICTRTPSNHCPKIIAGRGKTRNSDFPVIDGSVSRGQLDTRRSDPAQVRCVQHM